MKQKFTVGKRVELPVGCYDIRASSKSRRLFRVSSWRSLETHAQRLAEANDLEPTVPASEVFTPSALSSGTKNSTDD